MPIEFLPGSSMPTMPEKIERDGATYRRRVITARNIREGDLVAFIDGTGPVGTVSRYSIGKVWLVESLKSGYGRQYVSPWNRRVVRVKEWRGNLLSFQVPTDDMRYAHTDKVEIWRPITDAWVLWGEKYIPGAPIKLTGGSWLVCNAARRIREDEGGWKDLQILRQGESPA